MPKIYPPTIALKITGLTNNHLHNFYVEDMLTDPQNPKSGHRNRGLTRAQLLWAVMCQQLVDCGVPRVRDGKAVAMGLVRKHFSRKKVKENRAALFVVSRDFGSDEYSSAITNDIDHSKINIVIPAAAIIETIYRRCDKLWAGDQIFYRSPKKSVLS